MKLRNLIIRAVGYVALYVLAKFAGEPEDDDTYYGADYGDDWDNPWSMFKEGALSVLPFVVIEVIIILGLYLNGNLSDF